MRALTVYTDAKTASHRGSSQRQLAGSYVLSTHMKATVLRTPCSTYTPVRAPAHGALAMHVGVHVHGRHTSPAWPARVRVQVHVPRADAHAPCTCTMHMHHAHAPCTCIMHMHMHMHGAARCCTVHVRACTRMYKHASHGGRSAGGASYGSAGGSTGFFLEREK